MLVTPCLAGDHLRNGLSQKFTKNFLIHLQDVILPLYYIMVEKIFQSLYLGPSSNLLSKILTPVLIGCLIVLTLND